MKKQKLIAIMLAAALSAGSIAADLAVFTDGAAVVEAAGISKKKAKSIAKKDAGVGQGQIAYISCKKDYDDGREIFEVSIHTKDGGEYEYNIDAKTGAILEKDFDYDD